MSSFRGFLQSMPQAPLPGPMMLQAPSQNMMGWQWSQPSQATEYVPVQANRAQGTWMGAYQAPGPPQIFVR